MSVKHDDIGRREVESMLKAKIIKLACSVWAFPVVIAWMKDGQTRFSIYYWSLNKRMNADKFPIPKIEEVLDYMVGATVFSKLDMFAGYWQVQLADQMQEMMAFIGKYGAFQFLVMPSALMNALAPFQFMAFKLFEDFHFVKVYIDDVVIHSDSMAEHILHINVVCERIWQTEVRLKLQK